MAQYTAVDIPEADSQELSVLIAVFNKMLDKIQEQFRATTEAAEAKAELHVKELENLKITNQLRSSELKVLQMQMNPHFLFNTLNMIAKTAYLGDVQETVFLLQRSFCGTAWITWGNPLRLHENWKFWTAISVCRKKGLGIGLNLSLIWMSASIIYRFPV